MVHPTAAVMEVVVVETGIRLEDQVTEALAAEAVRLEVRVETARTAQAAPAAQEAQVDRAVTALEAVLGVITLLAEEEAEAEEGGPLMEEALHQAEDLAGEVMEAITGTKERWDAGRTLP